MPIAAVRNRIRWRPVDGFPWYRVSNTGVVQCCRERGPGVYLTLEWRTVTPVPEKDGYLQVRLWTSGRSRLYRVHTLVLLAFVGECPDGMEACHKDGDPTNNRLANLRWGTPKSNCGDRDRHGRTARRERNGRAKLTPEQVRDIRDIRSKGCPLATLAVRFGVSKRQIGRVVRVLAWK